MQEKSPCRAIFFVGCKSQVMFARSVAKAKIVAEFYSAKKALHILMKFVGNLAKRRALDKYGIGKYPNVIGG